MSFFFFFNDTATTEIYTLSLHDALPILAQHHAGAELLQQGVIGSHGHGLMPQPARYHLPHQGTKILMWKPLANEGLAHTVARRRAMAYAEQRPRLLGTAEHEIGRAHV